MHCGWRWVKAASMFKRSQHNRIAQVLHALNGRLLLENRCLFAGGTVIAMRYGEYRESVDIDFLVSDTGCYRNLREMLTGPRGIQAMAREGGVPLSSARDVRADQYGIRTVLLVDNQPVKFEIVREGRIEIAPPSVADDVCGIATLTPLDMATSKLLANSDRWNDDGVFSRDLIDLAMMNLSLPLLREAVAKAEKAYGDTILRDLAKAIDALQQRNGWLERCMQIMAMQMPKAQLWQQVRKLCRVLP
jgi:hypothetical protein